MAAKNVVVGVLCIQGAFIEHIKKLDEIQKKYNLSMKICEVRFPKDLEELDGLIIPGGESTTLSVFLSKNDFYRQLMDWLGKNKIIWGTCAGLILLSNELEGQKQGGQVKLGGLPVECTRNLFGRQMNSFEADVHLLKQELKNIDGDDGSETCPGVFIRAPGISKLLQPDVVTLGSLAEGTIVAVQYNNIIATCFHPELTSDPRWHLYFLDCIFKNKS